MKRCITVQSDYSIFLERAHPAYDEARDFLLHFADLEKCPEHLHTYRISKLSLWNAAALGFDPQGIINGLEPFLRFPIPSNVVSEIRDIMGLYGKLRLVLHDQQTYLESADEKLANSIRKHGDIAPCFDGEPTLFGTNGSSCIRIPVRSEARGKVKVAIVKLGYPVQDLAGYQDGDPYPISLNGNWQIRDYQRDAVFAFILNNSLLGGSGVLVLPCGAGKTVIGIATMVELGMKTLILTTSITAARQWRREILERTDVKADDIAEYSGNMKEIAPITIATYQILTSRKSRHDDFKHLKIFEQLGWGLIIYDEVHVLPAPIFHITAQIQSRRRLGLTATLVREDGKEDEVFSLIGPKRYDVPWKVLEQKGWIAPVDCIEVRVPFLSINEENIYDAVAKREQFKIASCNRAKADLAWELINRHEGEKILVIGMYLDQIRLIAERYQIPLVEGQTRQKRRDELFNSFRDGDLNILAISKVGNYALDLPDASVLIQVSGTFGSRQEEAQRLGRILRPKLSKRRATFYTLVTPKTEEERFAMNRQLFLAEQGYHYEIKQLEDFYPQEESALVANSL